MKISLSIILIYIAIGFFQISRAGISDHLSYYDFENEDLVVDDNLVYYGYVDPKIMDPLEPINRIIFDFNITLDNLIIEPAIIAYRFAVPEVGRQHITNFFRNLLLPVSAVNDVLQGDFEQAGHNLGGFLVNSLFGFFGINELADDFNIKTTRNEFAKTLEFYGIGDGPYIVMPILGPTSFAGLIGKVTDAYTERLYAENFFNNNSIRTGRLLNLRSNKFNVIHNIKNNSLDPYMSTKSAYLQTRYNKTR